MAKKNIAIPLCAFLLILSGCKDGHSGKIGVSAGTEQSTSTEQSGILSRLKTLTVGRSAKATIHIPATTLISQALLNDGVTRDAGKTLSFLLRLPKPSDANELHDRLWHAELYSRKEAGLALSPNPFRDAWLQLFSISMGPSPWWCCGLNRREAEAEGHVRAAAVYFTVDIYGRLSRSLTDTQFLNQDAAAAAIKAAYSQLRDEDLWMAYQAAWQKATAHNSFTPDWSGATKGAIFQLGGDTFLFEPNGNTVAGPSGKIWGDGWINGQQMAFNVEQSNGTSMRRETHDGEKGSVGTNDKNTTNVGVQ